MPRNSTFPAPAYRAPSPDDLPARVEEETYSVASYYGFASLSTRMLLGGWVRGGLPQRLNMSTCELLAQLFTDPVHPGAAGAGGVGSAPGLVPALRRRCDQPDIARQQSDCC
jgi:hypothetical protein